MTQLKKFSIGKLFRNLFWFIYCGIILSQIMDMAFNFFAEESGIPLFYKMLYYFYPLTFYTKYLVDLTLVVTTLTMLIPLFLYVFGFNFATKMFWKILFILQVVLTLIGNTYAKIQLKSFYQEGGPIFWIIFSSIIVLYAPFYYATFSHAFRQSRKSSPDINQKY